MVRITGDDKHRRRLQGMRSPRAIRMVGAALYAGGERIVVEAQLSISNGAVSGRNHVPSAPGDPPNYDTGVLANNIEANQVAPLKVEVSSNAPYAAPLEFGTSRMAERPYMRPAVAKTKREITELVRRAVDISIGGR